MTTLTVLAGHPLPGSFNSALAGAYAAGAGGAGASVLLFDVHRLAFDPVLHGAYREVAGDEPDLRRVREAFEGSAHVAWFFPTWWAGPPAKVKGLVDRLFLPGWAFRYEGGRLPRGLMAGRSARWVATMDSPSWWYRWVQRDAIGSALGRGTLSFVGFAPVRRTLVTGVRDLGPRARDRWLRALEAQGARDAREAGRRAGRGYSERRDTIGSTRSARRAGA
jgi:putative NADPH-quinone reductase